jgi:signal transduction histidine kinase
MVELMRVAYEKGEMESVQNRLALLMSEAANLSSALVNIVELSRLETATATSTYRSFDIVALLNEVSQTTRLNIGHKAVTIMDVSSTGPVMILSDPVKVRKIITGLLSNAAKFTDRGRIALILISDENGIRLIITDTGRGMTAEQMNDAFAPCSSRGSAAERGHAESVPGLRQIRNLVKLLEGSITVSSKVGEGTIVEVSFPLDPSENPAGSFQESEREFHSLCNGCNNVFSSYIKTGWGCNEERCPNQGG